MAAILSQYSTTGFSLNMPVFAHLRRYLVCRLPDIFLDREVRAVSFLKPDLYSNPTYFSRIFERRYGSHKFSSYLLATCTIATLIEVGVVCGLRALGLDWHQGGLLPAGPYGLIFPLFVNFFFDIPRVATTHVLGVPVTGKTLTYLLGLQVCSTSTASLVSGLCGVLLGIQRYLVIPSVVARACDATLGRLLRSQPPTLGPIGATLEIQRQQQMEQLEQQMLMARARDQRRHAQQHDLAEDGAGPSGMQQQGSEEQVALLVDMGFDRASVLDALRAANNDLTMATNLLLQEA
ncbi:hypothetical protein B566_EDAN001543 [Ephemera danica]|nr:hypothetical protein B566_EDAN001543 [Ephemera danica]